MDAICGCNSPGAVNPALSGFPPALNPGLGLATNRLGGPFGPATAPMMPDASGLLNQSMQMQSMMLQMMQLLMGLMTNQLSGQGGNQATAPISALSGGAGGNSSASDTSGANAGANAGAATGKAPANDTKDQGEIKSYIAEAAAAYGTDPKVLTEIARRESNFQAGAVNDWDSNAKKGTPSKGMFQFIEPTFKSYAPQAKKANPKAWEGLGELNWMDWRQQALTTSWAIKNGHGSAWATFAAAGGK